MRQRCLTALVMMWPLLALAQSERPPEQETEIAQTRAGYKARNDRHRSHEAMYARFWGGRYARRYDVGSGLHRAIVDRTLPPMGMTQAQYVTCGADAVAIVTVYNQRPVLAQGENFIFTEYKGELNEAIKGHLAVGQRITMTQIGGTIDLPGDRLGLVTSDALPLMVGSKYLAFLRYLPATDDYAIDTAYEVGPGASLRVMRDGDQPLRASAEFLNAVRALGPCS